MAKSKKNKFEISFSKSALDMLINCPLAYHYSKDEHLYEEEYQLKDTSEWLKPNEQGTFAHDVLCKYVNANLKGKKNSEIGDFNEKSFNEKFKECIEETEKKYPIYSEGEAKRFQKTSKKSLKQYLEELHKELKSKDNKWVISETEFNIDDCNDVITVNGNSFTVNYHGIVDRIDTYKENEKTFARIIDYKSGSKDKYLMYKNIENTSQHHIYKLLVEKKLGYEVEEFDYVFVFDDDKKGNEKNIKIEKDEFENPIAGSNYPRVIKANPDSKIEVSIIPLTEIVDNVCIKKDYMLDKLDLIKKEDERCKFCNYKNICLKGVI